MIIELHTPLEHKIWASTYAAMFSNLVCIEQRGRTLDDAIYQVSIHDCINVANEAVIKVREHIKDLP